MAEPGSVLHSFRLTKPKDVGAQEIERPLILETPIAIEINGVAYAVMMATPLDLEDFVLGFCLSEGLTKSRDDLLSLDLAEVEGGVIARAQLPSELAAPAMERARSRASESSCGLCGIESLEQVLRPLAPVTAQIEVADGAIFTALEALYSYQKLNAATGSAHAAAFCWPDGSIHLVREDVGRHNALDKLIGALARDGTSVPSGFILLTARCSFELAQKAIIANCPLLVTISAPTSLAVEQAKAHGLRLVSLARPDSFLES